MSSTKVSFRRVLLKISGEMMGGKAGIGLDGPAIEAIAHEVADVHGAGVQVAVVIGGGNIFRGATADRLGMERTAADYMGMLGTVINALALQALLENKFQLQTRVMTAITMQAVAEPYIRRKAIKHLENRRVVIFACGTGNPLFTTDTGAALRAREIGADIILKATKVDGVYDSDPVKNPSAKRFDEISYMDVMSKQLHIMDATAIAMCMETGLPLKVFKMSEPGCVLRAIENGSKIGTLVK